MLDFMLRTGPVRRRIRRRTRTGRRSTTCSAIRTAATSAPLVERLPEILRTPSGKIELAPAVAHRRPGPAGGGDRRARGSRAWCSSAAAHLRSNNSWMHNIEVLVKGKPRCTLQVHPDDAARSGLADGAPASITSRVGSVMRAGRGDRFDPPRRREPAPRVGSRRGRDDDARRRRARRRELQRAHPTTRRWIRCRAPRSSTASRSPSPPEPSD